MDSPPLQIHHSTEVYSMKMKNVLFIIFLIGLILACLRNANATTEIARVSSFIAGIATAVYLTVNIGMRYYK